MGFAAPLLPAIAGAGGAALAKGAAAGTLLASVGPTAAGALAAGGTSLLMGNDPLTAGLDALGGGGVGGAIDDLATVGVKTAGAAGGMSSAGLPTIAEKITQQSLAPALAASAQPALGTMGALEAAGSGLTSLFKPGGMQAFKDITGSSALSSVGLPAAGLAMQAMSPTSVAYGLPPDPYAEYTDFSFTPTSELRRRNMGYADGGEVNANNVYQNFNQNPFQQPTPQAMQRTAMQPQRPQQTPVLDFFNTRNAFTSSPLSNQERDEYEQLKALANSNQNEEDNGFADGGITSLNPMHGTFDARTNMPEYREPLGGFKKGGYLDGPGDGMSDSIKATIEGKQPARLADGEFVIPADVVSHLGNGSTKAGAKRLYSMMSKVRKARTGTTQQGKQIKAEKYMPA